MIKKTTYNKIGPYLEVDSKMGTDRISSWRSGNSEFCQYTDYVDRCNKLKYQKAFLKIPFAIDCEYSSFSQSNKVIFTNNELEKRFEFLDRPISTEEISNFQALTHNG